MNLIHENREKLSELCGKYHVERLYAFGSVLSPNFDEHSDVDFLVKFKPFDLAGYFDNFIEFKADLKSLFHREIDLVEEQTLSNPILLQSINSNKELVYG